MERQFPILQSDGIASIPWEMIAPHEKQAMRNHGGQTLERLAERGGLGASEALAVLDDRPWVPMPRDQAKKVLKMKVGEWQSDSNRLRIATLEAENAKLKAERDAHESLACDADDALKESEAENAKLRDLLRRVVAIEGAACDAGELEEAMASICPEIKSVIEPGNPGELGES